MKSPLLVTAAIAALGLSALLARLYVRDIQSLSTRLAAGSRVVQTSQGPVEMALSGEGPTLLVVHGAGGGYDQARLLAEAVAPPGYQYVFVSRFGYLRSPLPADASTAAQADALAALLDTLEVERAAVLSMSGGVPPTLQLAMRHPERIAAQILLSAAPFTPFGTRDQALPLPASAYRLLFASDFPCWLLQHLARPALQRIFDAPPALRKRLTTNERAFLEGLIDTFLPVRRRLAGLANEAAAIDPRTHYALDTVQTPTLVIHARDDGINPFVIGAHLGAAISGAEFRPLPDGGHLLLGHHARLRQWVDQFLEKHAGDPKRRSRRHQEKWGTRNSGCP